MMQSCPLAAAGVGDAPGPVRSLLPPQEGVSARAGFFSKGRL